MAVRFYCDQCNKEGEGKPGHVFASPAWMAPQGWHYAKHEEGVTQVCSVACMSKAEEALPPELKGSLDWRTSGGKAKGGGRKPGITPEECKWCLRLGHLCPGHAAQARRRSAASE